MQTSDTTREWRRQWRVLVVEDQLESMLAAQRVLSSNPEYVERVHYARDYTEALRVIEGEVLDCALLDVYFPEKLGSGLKEKGKALLQEFDEDETLIHLRNQINDPDESLQPLGLLVGEICQQRKIRFRYVSSIGFGHGKKDNPFYSLRNYFNKKARQVRVCGYDWNSNFGWGALDSEDPKSIEDYREFQIEHFIAKDVLRHCQDQGVNFDDLRTKLSEALREHPTYHWMNGQFRDNHDLVNWAIKLGILQPIKGEQTYKAAFSEFMGVTPSRKDKEQ